MSKGKVMMTEDEFTKYRDGRYARALKYYDDRAKAAQFLYHCCAVYVIVSSILIAPLLSVNELVAWNTEFMARVLSPTIAIAVGIAAHFHFHENWLSYRSTWDALQREIPFREAMIESYEGVADRNALFVFRVEALISREGAEWLRRQVTRGETRGPESSAGHA